MSDPTGFMKHVMNTKEILSIPASLTGVASTGLLIKMNADQLKQGGPGSKSNSPNVTAFPGSTVILQAPGAKPMNKIAEDFVAAGFADELGKLTGTAGMPAQAAPAESVEQRRAELNSKGGVLGQAGIAQSSATSVAVNQPAPAK